MQTVTVVRIEPIGGGTDTDDASITLRCGTTEVTAFLFGCVAHVGDIVQAPLSALDGEVRATYLEDWPADVKNEFHRERTVLNDPGIDTGNKFMSFLRRRRRMTSLLRSLREPLQR